MNDDLLIEVDHVSKKFCRGLKRALWYGVQDIAGELRGRTDHHQQLRPDEFWAVDDVSFQVRRGECLGLIGPNGAGKSTLLKMLNGLIKPDRGRIRMRGRVGALIELGTGFNPILTGRENIYNNAAVLGLTKREVDQRLDAIIDFADLPSEALDAPVQTYSSGMRVRLGFAIAAHVEPDVLLIDEVLAVGDVGFRMKCYRRLADLRNRGCCILLVTHSGHTTREFCEIAIYLDCGKKTAFGNSISVQEAYECQMQNARNQSTFCDSLVVERKARNPKGSSGLDIVRAELNSFPDQRRISNHGVYVLSLEVHAHRLVRDASIVLGIKKRCTEESVYWFNGKDKLGLLALKPGFHHFEFAVESIDFGSGQYTLKLYVEEKPFIILDIIDWGEINFEIKPKNHFTWELRYGDEPVNSSKNLIAQG